MLCGVRKNRTPISFSYIVYSIPRAGGFNNPVTNLCLTRNIFYAIIRESKGGLEMNVYIKNSEGQQTVRYLPLYKAIYLRILVFARYRKNERPIVRFVI
jgi:hypothetical protein